MNVFQILIPKCLSERSLFNPDSAGEHSDNRNRD